MKSTLDIYILQYIPTQSIGKNTDPFASREVRFVTFKTSLSAEI